MVSFTLHKCASEAEAQSMLAEFVRPPVQEQALASVSLNDSPAASLATPAGEAAYFSVLEWKMPERNLDYLFQPFVHLWHLLQGLRHYRNFLAFMSRGGLEGLIYRYNQQADLQNNLGNTQNNPRLIIAERQFMRLGTQVELKLCREDAN